MHMESKTDMLTQEVELAKFSILKVGKKFLMTSKESSLCAILHF